MKINERTIRQSSLNAYIDEIKPNLGFIHKRLLMNMALQNTWTNKELERWTGIPINSVSGRINELKRLGMVEECGHRQCGVTGRNVLMVRRKL